MTIMTAILTRMTFKLKKNFLKLIKILNIRCGGGGGGGNSQTRPFSCPGEDLSLKKCE